MYPEVRREKRNAIFYKKYDRRHPTATWTPDQTRTLHVSSKALSDSEDWKRKFRSEGDFAF